MKIRYILYSILIFQSCNCDCSKCEELLVECAKRNVLPVDLPKNDTELVSPSDSVETLEIGVNADNFYFFEEGGETFEYSEVIPELNNRMDSGLYQPNKLKISGDKRAHYESIFNLIALAKQNNWNPILTYSN